MAAVWYYRHNGEQKGPVTGGDLKRLAASRQIEAGDLVWRDGLPKWVPANKVPGLIPEPSPDLQKLVLAEHRQHAPFERHRGASYPTHLSDVQDPYASSRVTGLGGSNEKEANEQWEVAKQCATRDAERGEACVSHSAANGLARLTMEPAPASLLPTRRRSRPRPGFPARAA